MLIIRPCVCERVNAKGAQVLPATCEIQGFPSINGGLALYTSFKGKN